MLARFIIMCLTVLTPSFAAAQASSSTPEQHQHHAGGGVELFGPREASGTAWVPDETPIANLASQ